MSAISCKGMSMVAIRSPKLAGMALGGPVQGTIFLDDLGLNAGSTYTLDVFHAERCGSGSNFRIDTSIGCIEPQ